MNILICFLEYLLEGLNTNILQISFCQGQRNKYSLFCHIMLPLKSLMTELHLFPIQKNRPIILFQDLLHFNSFLLASEGHYSNFLEAISALACSVVLQKHIYKEKQLMWGAIWPHHMHYGQLHQTETDILCGLNCCYLRLMHINHAYSRSFLS